MFFSYLSKFKLYVIQNTLYFTNVFAYLTDIYNLFGIMYLNLGQTQNYVFQYSEHWCCDVTVEPIRKTVTTVGVEPQNVTRVINTTYQRDCKFGETPTSADGWLCEDVVSHVMYVCLIFIQF